MDRMKRAHIDVSLPLIDGINAKGYYEQCGGVKVGVGV
jgi:hypothetical protein